MSVENLGYSMPAAIPLYDRPPYLYRGGSILLCVYRARREVLKQIVPSPLVPLEDNLVYAWVNHFPTIGLGDYHEAIVSIPVELHGRKGQYVAHIYLDSDVPIA